MELRWSSGYAYLFFLLVDPHASLVHFGPAAAWVVSGARLADLVFGGASPK